MKKCNTCLVVKPYSDFNNTPRGVGGVRGSCRLCENEKRARYVRAKQATDRQQAIEIMGSKCCDCGFSDPRALQFDHIDGGGQAERRSGQNNHWVVRQILKGNTEPFQLLCANCNWIKRHESNEVPRKYMYEEE